MLGLLKQIARSLLEEPAQEVRTGRDGRPVDQETFFTATGALSSPKGRARVFNPDYRRVITSRPVLTPEERIKNVQQGGYAFVGTVRHRQLREMRERLQRVNPPLTPKG